MTRDAFAAGASPASDQEAHDLSAALDQFNAAIQRQGRPALSDIFDVDRLCDELRRLSTLGSSSVALTKRGSGTDSRRDPGQFAA